MSAAIEFRGVSRCYGDVRAVDSVSVRIEPGEFFAMLGPSGSGKTTCLRLIAGFETPDGGQILLGGEDVSTAPPYERAVNTVFQDYALFPHLNVQDNVAYALAIKGVAAAERRNRAREMLQMVRLADFAGRRPAQLSGGQRQRVALARALISRPPILLLDEPLGALDLRLREEMQSELRSLQRSLGVTFVFVTHDQGEALSMADRVAVFNKGRIEQLDTPQRLYTRPRTAFVARFVGSANVLEGALAEKLGGVRGEFAVRSEHVRVSGPADPVGADCMRVDAELIDVQYHGERTRYLARLADGELITAALPSEAACDAQTGAKVSLSWQRAHAIALEAA